MRVADFDFDLPPARIAQTPAEPRDHARLMLLDRVTGQTAHRRFYELDRLLPADVVLVFNETKVEPRRLFARKPTGGRVELLLLDELAPDRWECKVSPGVPSGAHLTVLHRDDSPGALTADVVSITDEGHRIIRFSAPVKSVWKDYGALPIPPYIKGFAGKEEDYQTVYAKAAGSVAAPTAGRHFTPALLQRLAGKGIQTEYLTLHVSRDTAFPIIKTDNVDEVSVHSEQVYLDAATADRLNTAKAAGKKIIAVGTTSVRSLEGVARLATDAARPFAAFAGQVDLFIRPGHRFLAVDGMLTNFHFPRSSLLMLVAAFAGREQVLAAYAEAVREEYRFFTFGDAMLIRTGALETAG